MISVRKIKFAIPFAILFLLLGILWRELSTEKNAYAGSMIGERVSSFSLPSVTGKGNLTSSSLKGKASILHFWGSWCSVCKAENPTLLTISRKYNVPIYGIAYKDSQADASAFLSKYGNPYRKVGYDEYGDVGVDFGIYATPELFVIGPNGKILYKHIGAIDMSTFKNKIYPLIKKYNR